MLRLDYVSCFLTILSMVLVGKKQWQGWVVAGANSIIICIIGMRTAEFGFLPGNLFCIGLYGNNLWNWRLKPQIANLRSDPLSNTWFYGMFGAGIRAAKPKSQFPRSRLISVWTVVRHSNPNPFLSGVV
jgi:hypothetical protein